MAKRNGNRNGYSHTSGGGPLGELRPLAPADFVEAKPMTGGAGAADYAISVYGNTDAQHAVPGSNVIAMNNPDAPVVAPVTGGNRGGRGMLTDMAVPALLLYANNKFKRGRSAKKMRKSVRKTGKNKSKKATRGKR
jgi:hypothetical protein